MNLHHRRTSPAAVLWVLVGLVVVSPVRGIDYQLSGTIRASATLDASTQAWTDNGRATVSGTATADLRHRFNDDAGDLDIIHHLSVVPDQDPAFDLYQLRLAWYPTDSLAFTAGRMLLSWGYGYPLAVTDRLQQHTGAETKAWADDQPRIRGMDGIGVEYLMGMNASVAAYASVTTALQDPLGVSAQDMVSNHLQAAVYGSLLVGGLDAYASFVLGPRSALTPGVGFRADLAGVLVAVEAALDWRREDDDLYEIVSSPIELSAGLVAMPPDWTVSLDLRARRCANGLPWDEGTTSASLVMVAEHVDHGRLETAALLSVQDERESVFGIPDPTTSLLVNHGARVRLGDYLSAGFALGWGWANLGGRAAGLGEWAAVRAARVDVSVAW